MHAQADQHSQHHDRAAPKMGCQPVRSELIERQLGARSPTERLQSQQTGERMGSRPSAAGGGGAPAPALTPADHRSTSKTQLLPRDRPVFPPSPNGYVFV